MIRIDLTLLLPILTVEDIDGTMNFLHFLQKLIRICQGILILNRMEIFLAICACLSASLGLLRAFETALSNKIRMRCVAISFFEFFMIIYNKRHKKLLLNAVSGIRTRVTGLETPNTEQAIL